MGKDMVIPVCSYCGAPNISRDATVRWDIVMQSWELSDEHDTFWCGACDNDCQVDDLTLRRIVIDKDSQPFTCPQCGELTIHWRDDVEVCMTDKLAFQLHED